ncbi:type I secretion C-terminal target domain-containing protein [Wenzhouxiangella limi]|uniref:Type I secretion C-terminal target domain-containing protein n=1 Tax=Wenzhouxiangella limi TaxID=2707351 RepID=A0A845V4I5_9GAMM|nr:type I secretion C-terminal target domain-containing protein [Wenzhouxiangella limi]NDY94875.1 type I secretion C-terminal target domain-containing protein [Wenzhouxiangella limi]
MGSGLPQNASHALYLVLGDTGDYGTLKVDSESAPELQKGWSVVDWVSEGEGTFYDSAGEEIGTEQLPDWAVLDESGLTLETGTWDAVSGEAAEGQKVESPTNLNDLLAEESVDDTVDLSSSASGGLAADVGDEFASLESPITTGQATDQSLLGSAEAVELPLADGDGSVDTDVDVMSEVGSAAGEPLNLGDLVEGATIDTISDYLTLNFDGNDTIIDVQPTAPGEMSQQFVLAGVDITGMGDTDQEILTNMIEDGMLKIDT